MVESYTEKMSYIESLRNDIQRQLLEREKLKSEGAPTLAFTKTIKRKLRSLSQLLEDFESYLDQNFVTDRQRAVGLEKLAEFRSDLEMLEPDPVRSQVSIPVDKEDQLLQETQNIKVLSNLMTKKISDPRLAELEQIQIKNINKTKKLIFKVGDAPSNWCLMVTIAIEVIAMLLIVFLL